VAVLQFSARSLLLYALCPLRYAVFCRIGNALHNKKGNESVKKRKTVPILKEIEKGEI
jgi:hypothetical protein